MGFIPSRNFRNDQSFSDFPVVWRYRGPKAPLKAGINPATTKIGNFYY